MKVRDVGVKLNEFHNIASTEDKKASAQTSVVFKNYLSDISKNNYTQLLTELATEITNQGEIVCKRCDIKELKRYKELISTFLQEAVKFSFEFDKQSKFDTFGRFRIYANIKKINQSIEGLTEEFLKDQKDPVEILKSVEDIKGLILDIIL